MNEIRDPNWMTHLWQRVKSLFSGLDARVTALEQGGGGGGGAVSGVKGDAEATYRTGAVNLTAANIGAKAIQTAVSDPTASGTAVTFIDTISQDTQGVITPTKKSVQAATQSADGLLSAADKTKLDGIASGAQVNTITGVKGGAESSYRTGNVNLTAANIGISLDYKIYNSVTDLGLTSGSATILAAFNAMAANTILICPAGEFASAEVPVTQGAVEIVKPSNAARSYVCFYGKSVTQRDWRMYLGATAYNGNDYDKPSGVWCYMGPPRRATYNITVSLTGQTIGARCNIQQITLPTGVTISDVQSIFISNMTGTPSGHIQITGRNGYTNQFNVNTYAAAATVDIAAEITVVY